MNSKAKEPLVAALQSILLPGLGQFYTKRIKKGFFFLLFLIILVFVASHFDFEGVSILFVFLSYSVFDAYYSAKAYNRDNGLFRNITFGKRVIYIAANILLMLIYFTINIAMLPLLNNKKVASDFKEGKYKEVVFTLNKVIKIQPNNAVHYVMRAEAYKKMGELDKAVADYTKVIELNPRKGDYLKHANLARGYIESSRGEVDKAIPDYTHAIEIAPNFAVSFNNRANCYIEKGNYTQAILDATKAIELDSNYAYAYDNRGEAYEMSGDYDKAIADCSIALQLKIDNATSTFLIRGDAYTHKEEYGQAIADYSRASELTPQDYQIYTRRAMAYYKNSEYDKAKIDVAKVKSLGGKLGVEFSELQNLSE